VTGMRTAHETGLQQLITRIFHYAGRITREPPIVIIVYVLPAALLLLLLRLLLLLLRPLLLPLLFLSLLLLCNPAKASSLHQIRKAK